jgi:hypothetical protein
MTREVTLLGALVLLLACGQQAVAGPPALKDAPVPGWPELKIETHYVARIAMRGYCLPVPAGTPIPESPLDSCARPDFWRRVCDIFIDEQHMAAAELLAHEQKRCRGYDYRDSDAYARAWRAWREHGENRYADRLDFEAMRFLFGPPASCEEGEPACVEMR